MAAVAGAPRSPLKQIPQVPLSLEVTCLPDEAAAGLEGDTA